MSEVLRQLVVELGFKVDQAAIPKVDRALAGATKQASALDKAMGSAFARFAGPAALAAGASAGVYKLAGALVDAGDAAVDFGRDMAPIQTLLGGDTKRVEELSKGILDLSTATGKSSKEIAGAVNDVLQAFDDSADTMKLTEIAVRGATAGGTDARTAFDLLSSTMLQFGKTGAGAAQETMDMAFAMRQFGKVEIPQMAHGLSEVASSMKDIGGTEKELFAIIGTAAGVTGPVEQTFTQLNGVITALKTPTKELQQVYDQLGITSIEAAVKQEGLFGVMKKIHAASGGSIEAFAKLIPDARASRMFSPLVTTLANRYGEAMQRVTKATGAAMEADKLFRGGLNKTGTELDQLDKKAEKMQTEFGKRLAPMQIAWKQFWVGAEETAINAIDDIQDKLTGQAKEGDKWGTRFDKAVVRIAKSIGPTIGAGAATLYNEATFNPRGALAIQAQYQSEMESIAGLSNPARRSTEAAAVDPAKQLAKQISNSVQIGSVSQTFVLPAGADADKIAAYVNKNLGQTVRDVARDLHNGASGENP